MSTIYQQIVLDEAELLINGLEDANFFKDYEIEDLTFTRKHLCDLLTEKFINGELDGDDSPFNDDEFDQLLKELVAGSVLYELKNKGLVDSYSDENTEEMFFLTDKGKKVMKEKNDDLL
jgi:hypothetical protein